ncbi:MAG: hypothetical protein F6J93_36060 [Oscillatoria sp. SIO1A7]|nr:hypothetical protein [Oscillatoria sp. SIO1A7]
MQPRARAFQYNRFLRKEQRLSRECCRPYALTINARENGEGIAVQTTGDRSW